MAAASGHGGYRQPAHPAPVSGPGALSARTDGGAGNAKQPLRAPTGMAYGDHQALIGQEHLAPMAGTPATPASNVQMPQGQPPQGGGQPMPPFGAGTTRPNEPVTHGVNIGAGGGAEALPPGPAGAGPGAPDGSMTQLLAKYSATDTTGLMGQLYAAAAARGV